MPTETPRIYWVAVFLGAILGALVGWTSEKSRMTSAFVASTELKAAEEALGKQVTDPVETCSAVDTKRPLPDTPEARIAAFCAPYRTFVDYRAPRASVFALFGSLVGLLAGMFVNKQLRVRGKARGWTD